MWRRADVGPVWEVGGKVEGREGPCVGCVWKPGVPENSAVARCPRLRWTYKNPTLGRGRGWAGEGMPWA